MEISSKLSSKLIMDDSLIKKLYKNDIIRPLMNHIVSSIHSYLYSNDFIQYMFKHLLNKIFLYGSDYLQKNVYSFHMKGSSNFMNLLTMHNKDNYECYGDYDFALVLNPALFKQDEFAFLRMFLIIGLLKNLSEICNNLSNNSLMIKNCKKLGIIFDELDESPTLEIINTGISSDDISLIMHYFDNNLLYEQFDPHSLINIKILTNINNDYTNHMLVSVGLKAKLNGIDVHLIDIVIPTYNSPSISYEWLLSTNKLYMRIYEVIIVNQTDKYSLYYCSNAYDYYILNLQSFFIDQLYSSHFTKFIEDGKKISKMELMEEKYTKRFKRALYIQIYVMSQLDLLEIAIKYSKLILPNKIRLVDLIVKVSNFHRILNA